MSVGISSKSSTFSLLANTRMRKKKSDKTLFPPAAVRSEHHNHGSIISPTAGHDCLDSDQLSRLEQSFRDWSAIAKRSDVRFSRNRLLLVFLLIRYTAAKLNEVLALCPATDMNWHNETITFSGKEGGDANGKREVLIAATLADEIRAILAEPAFQAVYQKPLALDPGFVRRKFYERAEACGFAKRLGGPEMLRKARAVELLQRNVPLPAVQLMLGHSTPNLTSSYVSFSAEELRRVERHYLEKESRRRTSARNIFFGKIREIVRGTIQSKITLITVDGLPITTVITNDSAERLGLQEGRLLAAEVKAPSVMVQGGEDEPVSSADNRLRGTIARLRTGQVTTECIVRVSDDIEVCAVVTTAACTAGRWREGDRVWVLFTGFSVVLQAE